MKISILINDITKLSTKTRWDEGLVTTIQFDAKIHPSLIARLLNIQRQSVPFFVTIGTNQAMMDLDFKEEKEKETDVSAFRS